MLHPDDDDDDAADDDDDDSTSIQRPMPLLADICDFGHQDYGRLLVLLGPIGLMV